MSFSKCSLPYYVGVEIKDRSKLLLLHTLASLGSAIAVDVKTGSEVVAIDRAAKKVQVRKVSHAAIAIAAAADGSDSGGGATFSGSAGGSGGSADCHGDRSEAYSMPANNASEIM